MLSIYHLGFVAQENYYKLLQVSHLATEEEIRKAYRQMALLYHPDSCGSVSHSEKFYLVKLAYQTLTDPEQRKAYDKENRIHEKAWESHDPYALPKHDVKDYQAALGKETLETQARSIDLLRKLQGTQFSKADTSEKKLTPTEDRANVLNKIGKALKGTRS